MSTWLMAAYGLGALGLLFFAVDSARIPSLVWFWSGYSRAGWWITFVACFVALGFPAFIAALVWRFGSVRKGLVHEVEELRGGGRERLERLRRSTSSIL